MDLHEIEKLPFGTLLKSVCLIPHGVLFWRLLRVGKAEENTGKVLIIGETSDYPHWVSPENIDSLAPSADLDNAALMAWQTLFAGLLLTVNKMVDAGTAMRKAQRQFPSYLPGFSHDYGVRDLEAAFDSILDQSRAALEQRS